MTREDFLRQIERLKVRWPKNFDAETIRLSGLHVSPIPAPYLAKVVDNWIATRKTSNPPMAKDFLEVRAAYDRTQEKKERLNREFGRNLGEIIKTKYKVDTLMEAVEIERLKIKLGEVK